jgi:hypothetical protein
MKKQPRKRRAVSRNVVRPKPSFQGLGVPLEPPTLDDEAVTKGLSSVPIRTLSNAIDYFWWELFRRSLGGDAEAEEQLLIFDACFWKRLQMYQSVNPEYSKRVEKKWEEIAPVSLRDVRGKSAATMSPATQIAHWICYGLIVGNAKHNLPLPPFSKATYLQAWLPAARIFFEREYGQDFENRPCFAHYWMKDTQHERTSRAAVRDAIWKDIKQSIRTIAPA